MSALETVARAIDPVAWDRSRLRGSWTTSVVRRASKEQAERAIAALRSILPPEAQAAVDRVMEG